jgi:ubiquinone/menaquinone biosynthesis C-methylase UbiE
MISAFSLFTHLLQTETYTYLEEAVRVLKPGGKIVFSYLSFQEPSHWPVFLNTKAEANASRLPHLNMFMENATIEVWARHLGLAVERFVSAREIIFQNRPLGQSSVVLVK